MEIFYIYSKETVNLARDGVSVELQWRSVTRQSQSDPLGSLLKIWISLGLLSFHCLESRKVLAEKFFNFNNMQYCQVWYDTYVCKLFVIYFEIFVKAWSIECKKFIRLEIINYLRYSEETVLLIYLFFRWGYCLLWYFGVLW